jgi:hypothetical protein
MARGIHNETSTEEKASFKHVVERQHGITTDYNRITLYITAKLTL